MSLERSLDSLEMVVHLSDIAAPDSTAHFLSKSCGYAEFLQRGSNPSKALDASRGEISSSDILNIQFTSGSTGMPKAAALTHSGLLNSSIYIGQNLGVTNHDRIVIPVPLFHAFGLIMGKIIFSCSLRRLTRYRTLHLLCSRCHGSSPFRVLRCWNGFECS